jgi:alkanesulfonate monooxygenase SsuD/methylene tetrahydromethanopterin reductase-like flavin-dependent oxidoreductase (luciferase family)
MFIMRFTERPYVAYSESQVKSSFRSSVRLTFSNANFDPEIGTRVYDEAFEENQYAEEAGFDGIMLNEHHNTPTCMGATMNLEAAVLARITRKPKIVLLGNPLPIFDNPLRLAEELAEIDMMSHGRLVSGFVRGTGVESWATNTNPIHNRERFQEAHDLVIKAWTTPGPFRWEGKHYQFRVVNPFQVPLQKPHPPVWIPGVGSPETLVWSAQHRYPYIYLETDVESTVQMMSIYGHVARGLGYESGPQHFGYLWRIHVQDTDQKASESGKGFLTGNAGVGRVPMPVDFMAPPGYNLRGQLPPDVLELYKKPLRHDPLYGGVDAANWEQVTASNRVVVGSPKTVIAKIRQELELLRPGILGVWSNDGTINHEDSMRCLKLMKEEVLPAVREIARELELPGPFEVAP